ncbi:hypothetical protein N7471_005544, partial [Penicillium samsonianum]|uniref:uncharacterized protein n=1 Tax=Penicillium samsonianum TaxID=1882272 RepID=UPI0025480480
GGASKGSAILRGSPLVKISRTASEDKTRAIVPVARGQREWERKKICDIMVTGDVDNVKPNIMLIALLPILYIVAPCSACYAMLQLELWLWYCSDSYDSGFCCMKQKSNPKEPMTQLSPDSYGIRNELLAQKIDGSGGYLHVPEAPGLGTTVDEQVFSRLATI